MWFRCSGGNGTGDGATITVTYSSQFYNKTMTCTKGTKTYTKTTTSSGSTVFDVDESGTWTITCNGTSRTVDVVLEYSTQMAITKTITVYSAASDTVSFTDAAGAKTVTTNTSGQGSVSITFMLPSSSITFTSSVAKNPNNLSQAYSKTITIDSNTTAIYVMPNKTLYWWGYVGSDFEECNSTNGWSYNKTLLTPTYNTRDILLSTGNNACAVSTKTAMSGNFVAILTGTTASSGVYGWWNGETSKSMQEADQISITSGTITKYTKTVSNKYPVLFAVNSRAFKVHAFWYE